jgi:hypothetical protein
MNKQQRLSDDGTKRLLEIGLTKEQVFWINQSLPIIIEDLRQPAQHRAVRKELKKITGYLAKIENWCVSAKKSTLRQADKVAFGHIGVTAAHWKHIKDPERPEDTIPERMDLQAMAQSFREIVEMAQEHFPADLQRPRRSAVGVIEKIEAAINRPEDDRSRECAQKFQLLSKPNVLFLEIAEIIFFEATGKPSPSPEYAIRQFLERRAQKHSR